jgi:signal transduction histidine kinase
LRAVDRRRYERELINAPKQGDELKTALEERLRQDRENAELRERFIAALGHDLRNPLASITCRSKAMGRCGLAGLRTGNHLQPATIAARPARAIVETMPAGTASP